MSGDSDDAELLHYFERRAQELGQDPATFEAHRILTSTRRLGVTEANDLGIERVINLMAEQPITINKYGQPIGHMYSDEHWTKVFSVTTDLTSNSLHALAGVLRLLSIDQLMTVIRPLQEILDFSGEPE